MSKVWFRTFEQKTKSLLAQADAYRKLSSSLTFDDAKGAANGS